MMEEMQSLGWGEEVAGNKVWVVDHHRLYVDACIAIVVEMWLVVIKKDDKVMIYHNIKRGGVEVCETSR